MLIRYLTKCACMVKVVIHTLANVCTNFRLYIVFLRNSIQLVVLIYTCSISDCLCLPPLPSLPSLPSPPLPLPPLPPLPPLLPSLPSSPPSQVLLDDFSKCGGYRFLHDYLLHLERKKTAEAREAERNMVLLIQKLALVGFLNLEPTLSEGSPFQDPGFSIPVPAGDGECVLSFILMSPCVNLSYTPLSPLPLPPLPSPSPDATVKNLAAFNVLQDAFVSSHTSHLGCSICDSILGIFESDPANYFITETMRTLPYFLEALTSKHDDVQVSGSVMSRTVLDTCTCICTNTCTYVYTCTFCTSSYLFMLFICFLTRCGVSVC